jgi:hypothetical protein
MKGDFTRSSFRRDRHYSSVRMQQGRVQLDADWNEQLDINAHRDRTTHRDVIGYCGGPKGKDDNNSDLAGFKITALGANLSISKGRYYANGILCENEADVLLTKQENLPDFDPISKIIEDSAVYLAYLDVWERHMTALEDSEIREVALGGPDTTTRTKVVWQVKLDKVGEADISVDCSAFGPDWMPAGMASTGKLAARAEPSSEDEGPCIVPSKAGYRRLENQLYRVEIHQGGGIGTATFKWSRENGSVVISWEDQDGNNLIVNSPGRDRVLGFSAGDWVELTDDTRELHGKPGVLVRLWKIDGQVFTIDPATIQDPDNPGATSVDHTRFSSNKKIRRWESNSAESVTIPSTNDGWIDLEDGVEIKFQPGDFQPGDYWLIPARTALGNVLWPVDDATGEAEFRLRHGKEHNFCPLALVTWQPVDDEALTAEIIEDCRPIFPPLTNICAEDVCFNNSVCMLPGASTVQDAIDVLCRNHQGSCTLVPVPGKEWEKILDQLVDGQDVHICFQVGEYPLEKTITLRNLGSVKITGCGTGTRITVAKSEAVFEFENCRSVHIQDLCTVSSVTGFQEDWQQLNGTLSCFKLPRRPCRKCLC